MRKNEALLVDQAFEDLTQLRRKLAGERDITYRQHHPALEEWEIIEFVDRAWAYLFAATRANNGQHQRIVDMAVRERMAKIIDEQVQARLDAELDRRFGSVQQVGKRMMQL